MAEKCQCRAVTVSHDECLLDGRVCKKGLKVGEGAFKHAQKAAVAACTVEVRNGSKIQIVVPVLPSVTGLKKYRQSVSANVGAEAGGVFAVGIFGRKAGLKGIIYKTAFHTVRVFTQGTFRAFFVGG